jgi:hypothetical protein
MAGNGIASHGLEFIEGVSLGEDGKAEGAGLIAAFWGFFDGEDDSVGGMSLRPGKIIRWKTAVAPG